MGIERIALSNQWLLAEARHCGADQAALLLEGYPATGFGIVRDGVVQWRLSPYGTTPENWDQFADLRLFGNLGEWHCWNDGNGWRGRFAEDWPNSVKRRYALWGKPVRRDDWWECHEARGATVWAPAALVPAGPAEPDALYLDAVLRVDKEEGTGLASITDLRLRGFSWEDR